MTIPPIKTDPELLRKLEEAKRRVEAMTPEEREAMHRGHRESWARVEMLWPKARYRWINGVKVYDSYEDYCND